MVPAALVGRALQAAPGSAPAPCTAGARAAPARSAAPLGLRAGLPPRSQARQRQLSGGASGARQSADPSHAAPRPQAPGADSNPNVTQRSASPPACAALPLPVAAGGLGGAGGAGAWAASERAQPRASGLSSSQAAFGSPDPWPSSASMPWAPRTPGPAAADPGQAGGGTAAGGAAHPQAAARSASGAPPHAATGAREPPGLSALPCTTASAAGSEEVAGAMRAPASPSAGWRARRRTRLTARKRCGFGRVALAASPLAALHPGAAGPSELGGGASAEPEAVPAPEPAEAGQSLAATDSSHIAPRPLVARSAQARHPAISAEACGDVLRVGSASNLKECAVSNTCCSCCASAPASNTWGCCAKPACAQLEQAAPRKWTRDDHTKFMARYTDQLYQAQACALLPKSPEPLPQLPRPETQGVACAAAAAQLGSREDPSGARSAPASPRATAGRAGVQASSGRSAKSGATAATAGGRAGDDASTCRTEPQQDPRMLRPAGGLAEGRHSPARAASAERRHPASERPKQPAHGPDERPAAALAAGAAAGDAPEVGRSTLPGEPVLVEGACVTSGARSSHPGRRCRG